MVLGHKVYTYKHGGTFYYLTLNGVQFGSVMSSIKEVEEAKQALLKGENPWDKKL